jgi:hypothetical protein
MRCEMKTYSFFRITSQLWLPVPLTLLLLLQLVLLVLFILLGLIRVVYLFVSKIQAGNLHSIHTRSELAS